MRLFGIKCEVCCHKHLQENAGWRQHEPTPDGWFTVFQGDPQTIEPWHFCSFECLHVWAERSIHSEEQAS